MPAPYRRLGRIVKTHGTKGEVSVALRDGISSSLLKGAGVWIVPPPASGAIERRVADVRETPASTLVRIEGIDTPGEAHEIVGAYLLAEGEEIASADGTESLVGFEVEDETRGHIGIIEGVIHTGANDVLVVRGVPYGEVLVPVIPDVMRSVDDANRLVRVALLEGLIEEEHS